MKNIAFILFSLLALKEISFAQGVDTVFELNTNRSAPAIYKDPKGGIFKVLFLSDPFEKKTNTFPLTVNCGASNYTGTDRAQAKTSLLNPQSIHPTAFTSIATLLSKLPSDKIMRAKLTKSRPRTTDEMHNISLSQVYIFAIKKESNDNDYHLIIGDNINYKKATLLNAEISGIPNGRDKAQLEKVRSIFESEFVKVCGSNYAVFIDNPIKIKIQGSIFYDIDHLPCKVGPSTATVHLNPPTAWEIHPIASIAKDETK